MYAKKAISLLHCSVFFSLHNTPSLSSPRRGAETGFRPVDTNSSGLRKIAAENQEESDTVFNSSSTSVPTASVAPSSAAMMSSVQTVVMEEWEHVREQYGNLPQIPQSKQPQVFNSCTPPCVASSNSQRDDAFPVSVELK